MVDRVVVGRDPVQQHVEAPATAELVDDDGPHLLTGQQLSPRNADHRTRATVCRRHRDDRCVVMRVALISQLLELPVGAQHHATIDDEGRHHGPHQAHGREAIECRLPIEPTDQLRCEVVCDHGANVAAGRHDADRGALLRVRHMVADHVVNRWERDALRQTHAYSCTDQQPQR